MPIVKSSMTESLNAGLSKNTEEAERLGFGGVFVAKCYDADGNLKWEDSFPNLVTNVGLQDINTKYFKGVAYTAGWYLGLIQATATYASTDTLASHSGWVELAANSFYSGVNRIQANFGSATSAHPSVISNSASPAVFNIIIGASTSVAGAFLCSSQLGTDNTGILFSEANFTGGAKSVVNGDTINVTYTFNADL